MNIRKEFEKRENELNAVLTECDNRLKKMPEGKLKVITKKGKPYYYFRKDGNDASGTYIRRKNLDKARKLAQRDYEIQVKKALSDEMMALSLYSKAMPEKTYEHVYDEMIYGRKILITPHFLPDEVFVEKWLAEPYEPLNFDGDLAEHYTDCGERVRSKSEVLIANALNKEGISYKYECPLFLGNKKLYPDFTIMKMPGRKVVYWEHLGLLDDAEYIARNLEKIDCYEENGIFLGDNLIITRETSEKPLNMKQVRRLIDHYLL
ncbi:hypothetical protein [Butyrivibrio sp. XPD2002]|uniref:hypothetical protein n=1 Tax=Butyrivibrio sp. XPD2002 TaxID=1280665 RepID=UPI00041FEF15|nr:hypothetical protein [Butyrivibrio sp. XPD2002]